MFYELLKAEMETQKNQKIIRKELDEINIILDCIDIKEERYRKFNKKLYTNLILSLNKTYEENEELKKEIEQLKTIKKQNHSYFKLLKENEELKKKIKN